MASKLGANSDREIVLAIVAPIGSPTDEAADSLTSAFGQRGFAAEPVRVSHLIDTAVRTRRKQLGQSRHRLLMNKGDRLRKELQEPAAGAYLASQAIQLARKAATGSPEEHRTRHVNLVRSLKTPDEVRLLRQIYGPRCVVVGISASEEQRRVELVRQLRRSGLSAPKAASEAAYLMIRDDKDEANRHGQRMRDAYRLADVFLPTSPGKDDADVTRLVDLLLGDPWITPTRDEQAMFHAWAAKFRSSAAGRQVGAAVTDRLGEVVTLGCNDVPRPDGGQYWPDHQVDQRDFRHNRDANDQYKYQTAHELLRELARHGWLSAEFAGLDPDERTRQALRSGPLDGTRLSDLIEFGRIAHAEMAALMTAAREGRPVDGGTLFTTTYPCHECARLIIASGIRRVVFIDPYQKSLAPELYVEMWDASGRPGRVRVEPFAGVSPRLFPRVFEMSNRTKDVEGTYDGWTLRTLTVEDEEFTDSIVENEKAAGAYFKYLTTTLPERRPKRTRGRGADRTRPGQVRAHADSAEMSEVEQMMRPADGTTRRHRG